MRAKGPYFEELEPGQIFDTAPPVTLTDGMAAVHRAIVDDQLRLPLDDVLSAVATGSARLAHPTPVRDVAIGQSTVVTHHVKVSLCYRGLALQRKPRLGDALITRTTVEGLRHNRRRPGRAPTGLVALRIHTVDQDGRDVQDFWRCALLPLREDRDTGRADDLDAIGSRDDLAWASGVEGWDLRAVRSAAGQSWLPDVGGSVTVVGGDVVDGAAQLARLTLNIARVHHDSSVAGGRRLVYGGHTIGIALSQVSRAFPGLLTVVGWRGCDHLGRVHEGDTLRSVITVEAVETRTAGGRLVRLRSRVEAAAGRRAVLDWRYLALFD